MSIVAAELVARVTADVSQAERELRGFSNRMGSMTGSVFSGNLLSGGVAALGRGLMDVGRIGVGVFADIASSGADFEARMDGVAAVLGGTAEQADLLGQLAIDLAIDPNLKVDATQAADAIANLATAGLTAQEILDGATKATILLANSTGGDFGQAATVATDVMSLFNIEAGDMMDAVDGIAAVSNVSKFDLNDYALAISQAGGVAALSGVSFEDFNATIAATAPYFASGSDAGTAFKTFLQRLNPTTKEAKDLMFELGLLTEDGTSIFYDATGALKDMVQITGIMNDTFGDMTESQKSFYLGQLFGTDAMRTAGAISEQTTDSYVELKNAMADTSALDSARVRTDNFKSAMENLQGAIEASKLQIWDAFEPVAQDIVVSLSPLIEWVTPKIQEAVAQLASWIQAEIPRIQVAVETAYELTGSPLAAGMTGLAELVGAEITFDAEGIVTLDWGIAKTTFDAVGNVILEWDMPKGAPTIENLFGDQRLDLAQIIWDNTPIMDFGAKLDFSSAASKLRELFEAPAFTFNPDALIPKAIFDTAFEITTKVMSVDWGTEFNKAREVTVKVGEVLWGIWTHVYDVTGQIALMLWGTWTYTYEVTAQVFEVIWGAFTHVYDAIANIFDWNNSIGVIDVPGRVVIQGEPVVTYNNLPGHGGNRERASGDPLFSGGWTLVGERGPEMVRLPRASRIYDDQETAGMMGGQTVVNNYNVLREPHEIELLAQRVAAHIGRRSR